MRFPRTAFALLAGVTFGLAAACGSKSFDNYESGGGAGKGGTESGSGGSAAAKGGDAGSSGASGSAGHGGTGGSGTGGTGRGGTGTGGMGAGGTDVGGASGTGGAGANGGAGGFGGMAAGAGGDLAGAGGSAAGAGGSVAGAGGCGICPFVACLPPVVVTVTAPGNIAGLEGQLEDRTAGTTLGPLQCFANTTSPCTWDCQFFQLGLGTADYSIVLSAPGYADKTIDFSIEAPQNCGCCGCRCGVGYNGSTELEPDGSETPACCASLTDTTNCGSCGNQCDTGAACTNGECTPACLGENASCDGGGTCCAGLTCCSGAAAAPKNCYAACPP